MGSRFGLIRTVADLYGEMDDTVRSWRREAKNDPLNWMDALPPGLSKEEMYRLQFLGHRVEPYAALATG